jgi:hypothetical protein
MIWCRKFQERYGNFIQHNVDQMTRWREVLEETNTKFSRTRNTLYIRQPTTSLTFIQTNKQTNKHQLQYNAMKAIPSVAKLAWHLVHIRKDRRSNCQAQPTADTQTLHVDTQTLHVDTSS